MRYKYVPAWCDEFEKRVIGQEEGPYSGARALQEAVVRHAREYAEYKGKGKSTGPSTDDFDRVSHHARSGGFTLGCTLGEGPDDPSEWKSYIHRDGQTYRVTGKKPFLRKVTSWAPGSTQNQSNVRPQ